LFFQPFFFDPRLPFFSDQKGVHSTTCSLSPPFPLLGVAISQGRYWNTEPARAPSETSSNGFSSPPNCLFSYISHVCKIQQRTVVHFFHFARLDTVFFSPCMTRLHQSVASGCHVNLILVAKFPPPPSLGGLVPFPS